jgi:pyroglutamyl-peptidase
VKRLLVTGFEPFGAHEFNPSAAVLEHLPDLVGGVGVDKLVLPVKSEGVKQVLARVHSEAYDAVLHLGLADERPVITIERRAVNLCEFRIPDNEGRLLRGIKIVDDGPDAYDARLPIDAILDAWERAGIPAAPSDSAGQFLCNQVMYTSLHVLPEPTPTGFIHLPLIEILDLGLQARALRLALEVIARAS